MDVKLILGFLCAPGIIFAGISEAPPRPNDVERFLMVKVNESDVFPCVLQARPTSAVRKRPVKRRDSEGLSEYWRRPSMCSKCVACAALVFGLVKEFEEGDTSRADDDELDVVCDRKLPLYEMWDVSRVRYFGEPTVNARRVVKHESLEPSIQDVCQQMRNMTNGRQLFNLWRQDKSRFMNRLCFNPYYYPGLASCRGLLKKTKGIDRMKICRKPLWAYFLERIVFWDKGTYKFCEEKEYQLLLSWYMLGNHDYVE